MNAEPIGVLQRSNEIIHRTIKDSMREARVKRGENGWIRRVWQLIRQRLTTASIAEEKQPPIRWQI